MRASMMTLLLIPLSLGCDPNNDPYENTGFCGELVLVTVDFEAIVWDPQNDAPVGGAELVCSGETEPRAISDEAGGLQFSVDIYESVAGCGYTGNCKTITVRDPDGTREPVTLRLGDANGTTIELQ